MGTIFDRVKMSIPLNESVNTFIIDVNMIDSKTTSISALRI